MSFTAPRHLHIKASSSSRTLGGWRPTGGPLSTADQGCGFPYVAYVAATAWLLPRALVDRTEVSDRANSHFETAPAVGSARGIAGTARRGRLVRGASRRRIES